MESDQGLAKIFSPGSLNRRKELHESGDRFAHYTTAENASKIFSSQEIWMRNAIAMDDYSEIKYGYDLLIEYFHDQSRREKRLSVLDKCCGMAGKEAIDRFDKHFDEIKRSTYICCFSEHGAKHDMIGRLSMWRAFGRGSTGVAIVFRPPEENVALPLRAFMVPVMYQREVIFAELDGIFNRIEEGESYLKSLSRDVIFNSIFAMLVQFVTSIKHPGFEEEQEWRLIHMPTTYSSTHVKESIEVFRGVPQVIRKIELKNNPGAGINNIELPELLERVIIGPSEHGYSVYEALAKKLEGIGVEKPWEKVSISRIPLRT